MAGRSGQTVVGWPVTDGILAVSGCCRWRSDAASHRGGRLSFRLIHPWPEGSADVRARSIAPGRDVGNRSCTLHHRPRKRVRGQPLRGFKSHLHRSLPGQSVAPAHPRLNLSVDHLVSLPVSFGPPVGAGPSPGKILRLLPPHPLTTSRMTSNRQCSPLCVWRGPIRGVELCEDTSRGLFVQVDRLRCACTYPDYRHARGGVRRGGRSGRSSAGSPAAAWLLPGEAG